MLAMLRDLVAHKWHANAALLGAIRQNEGAVSDSEIWNLLHHILIANRFWLLTTLGLPFVLDDESRPAGSFGALVQRYARTQADEEAWLETATDSALERIADRWRARRCVRRAHVDGNAVLAARAARSRVVRRDRP